MRVGAVFPQLEIGADPAEIARYALTLESLGYDHLVAVDHVLGAHPERPGGWSGPYDHRSMFHEPFVLFAYLAPIVTRLRFATAVIVLPQRQTALVAKQAANQVTQRAETATGTPPASGSPRRTERSVPPQGDGKS